MKKVSNILWGLVLVVVGVILGLNTLGITNINIFFRGWWTLFIIIPSFIGVLSSKNKTGDLIGLAIGIALFCAARGHLRYGTIIKLLFPTILVIIGLSIIFKDTLNSKIRDEIKKINKTSDTEYCATFGGQDINITEKEEFNGCNLDAVFAGIKCDLTKAKILDDVVINACAVFGGIKIIAPENVNIKVTSTPIFGGVSNQTNNVINEKNKTIYINATCIFGGVEIK